jgi:hypothetical protein
MPLPCALARLPKSCYSISSFPSSQFLNSYCEYVAHMCHSVGMISCRRVCRQKKKYIYLYMTFLLLQHRLFPSLKSGKEHFCAHSPVFIQSDGKINKQKKSLNIFGCCISLCARLNYTVKINRPLVVSRFLQIPNTR